MNRLFVVLFENNAHQTTHTTYFLPTIKIKDYNVINDGRNFFDQIGKNYLRTYKNIQKIAYGEMITQLVVC